MGVAVDLYQIHAYSARYGCEAVALLYPRSRTFEDALHYRFFDGRSLFAIPFDVTKPRAATERVLDAFAALRPTQSRSAPGVTG